MDTTLERVVELYLTTKVQGLGGMSTKLNPTEAGVPDRMIILDGIIYLVEVKKRTGRLRPIQIAWHKRAMEHGVEVIVLYGKEGVDAWLSRIA